MTNGDNSEPASDAHVAQQIRVIRGQRVLLDSDLAALYGVTTKRLNEQVRRNIDRFPADFIFPLTNQDLVSLRSQFATLKTGRGAHRKYAPLAFTEHGAIMAATILNSPVAVEMSVHVVRAFVRLRQALATNAALVRKLDSLERSLSTLDSETRREFARVYGAILKLMGPDMPQQ
jgi:phage regulator Rha-like protein